MLREGRVSGTVFHIHVPLRDRIALGTSEVVTQVCACGKDRACTKILPTNHFITVMNISLMSYNYSRICVTNMINI